MQKRIIITTGYMGSGSSAATDLIAEFKDCSNEFKSHEYIFLHCPDGVFDLEDRLLRNNNALRSDEALRTFTKRMHELYDKRFWWVGNYVKTAGVDFLKYSDEFVQAITQYRYPGYWYMSEYPDSKMILKLLALKPWKILFGKFHTFKKVTRYDGNMLISFVNEQQFYQHAKRYIYQVIHMMRKDAPNILLDQLLLPFNLHRMEHYFDDDAFAIVVDRDPRDVFLLNKYIWGKKNISIAMPLDVHEFCAYYRAMREAEKPTENKQILRIHFEDLIYHYEETLARIQSHLHFDESEHIHKKERFNPEISIRNTQLFHEPSYAQEAKVIEETLQEFLYDFPYEVENGVENSVEFD